MVIWKGVCLQTQTNIQLQLSSAYLQFEYFSLKAFRRSIFFRTLTLCNLLRSDPLRRWRKKRLSGKWSDEEDLRRSGRDLLPPRSFIERISILSATYHAFRNIMMERIMTCRTNDSLKISSAVPCHHGRALGTHPTHCRTIPHGGRRFWGLQNALLVWSNIYTWAGAAVSACVDKKAATGP